VVEEQLTIPVKQGHTVQAHIKQYPYVNTMDLLYIAHLPKNMFKIVFHNMEYAQLQHPLHAQLRILRYTNATQPNHTAVAALHAQVEALAIHRIYMFYSLLLEL
jgi:hypothetical protein